MVIEIQRERIASRICHKYQASKLDESIVARQRAIHDMVAFPRQVKVSFAGFAHLVSQNKPDPSG
jgi:hypothetical protein